MFSVLSEKDKNLIYLSKKENKLLKFKSIQNSKLLKTNS